MREKHASRRNDRLTSPTPTRRRLRRRLRQMFPSLAATPCTPAAACHAHHNWAGKEGGREGGGPRPKSVNKLLWISSSVVRLSVGWFFVRPPFIGWKLGVPYRKVGMLTKTKITPGYKEARKRNALRLRGEREERFVPL